MVKKFGFKALAMVAGLGMSVVVVGCNPAEEAPKPAPTPTPAPAVKPKAEDKKDVPPVVTPPKKAEEAKTK